MQHFLTMAVQHHLRPERNAMRNPWLKKNPLMSLWLSGANAMAIAIHGQATAQIKRQAVRTVTSATDNLLSAWTGAAPVPPATKTRAKTKAKAKAKKRH